MKAMVLCAGRGERMLPLTAVLPKPALPVLGRPLAAHTLARLGRSGVDEVAINLHHHGELLPPLLGSGSELGLRRIHYTREETILGTAGGILNAAEHLRGAGPFLVVNGDFLSDIDVAAAVEAHRRSGCPATLVLAPARPGYSVVRTDDRGRIVSIGGDRGDGPSPAPGGFLFTGLQVLDEEILGLIPPGGPRDIIRDVHLELVERGRLGSFVHGGFWWEFGGLRAFLDGTLALVRLPAGTRERIAPGDPRRDLGDAVAAVGPGAEFHNAVELRGAVALGMACRIGEGTCLEDVVVMPEAWIGPGCNLADVLVGPGVEIPAGFEMRGAVIAERAGVERALPPDTERIDDLLVRRC